MFVGYFATLRNFVKQPSMKPFVYNGTFKTSIETKYM